MPGRSYNSAGYRYGFNGKEKDDEVKGSGNSLDFTARIYDSRLGRFLSIDPEQKLYAGWSSYHFVRSNPILRIDPTGKWDITVHAYTDRNNYGYGLAIVTDRSGKEIQRFKVRLQGTRGSNRMVENSDTPLGTYDIPDANTWITGGARESYGPNARLNLNGQEGEIITSGRSAIRIHGGRQETYDAQTDTWTADANPVLKKTHGCLRCFDTDVDALKTITDELESNDSQESPGVLKIQADLVNYKGNYYAPNDYDNLMEAESDLKEGQEEDKNNKFLNGGMSYSTSQKAAKVAEEKSKGIN